MKRPVVLRRMAQSEFDEASNFYESRGQGLGDAMTDAVKKVLLEIGEQPNRYPIIQKQIREAIVADYPYAIYYRVERKQVIVLSVFHTSRDPQIWKRRS